MRKMIVSLSFFWRFLHMLYEHRGLEAARILLHPTNVSEGYTALGNLRQADPPLLAMSQLRLGR
jgi:hypothetical protein